MHLKLFNDNFSAFVRYEKLLFNKWKIKLIIKKIKLLLFKSCHTSFNSALVLQIAKCPSDSMVRLEIVHSELLPEGQTVCKDYFLIVIRYLWKIDLNFEVQQQPRYCTTIMLRLTHHLSLVFSVKNLTNIVA